MVVVCDREDCYYREGTSYCQASRIEINDDRVCDTYESVKPDIGEDFYGRNE